MFKTKKNRRIDSKKTKQKSDTPEYILPVISLDGDIMGPEIDTYIDLGDTASILAVEEASKHSNLVCFVNRLNVEKCGQETEKQDICCIADVKDIIRLGKNTIRISVRGLNRAMILSYVFCEPYVSAKVRGVDCALDAVTEEQEALLAILKERYLKYLTLIGRYEAAMETQLEQVDPDRAIDIIASNLPLSVDEYYRILEDIETSSRLKLTIETISKLSNIAEMELDLERQLVLNLSNEQKSHYLKEKKLLINKELNEDDEEETIDEYRQRLESLPLEAEHKQRLLKEMDRFEMTPPGSQEASVIQSYLDYILDLPWEKTDGEDFDIEQASKILNDEHYGLEKVKERILEYLAVIKLTGSMKSPILCLVGPPGVGKTSIAKSIAHATERKFVRVSLGGMHDEAEIRGHRKTYVGAMPGRIIAGLRQVQSKNPVFLLDEIDKLSKDMKGDPASALLEALDPEQNATFTDTYIEVPFDLSGVMFITTANMTSTIPNALLDRLEVIELSGYMPAEKLEIAKRHLIPKQLKANGITEDNLKLTDDVLMEIVESYTRESGVRQLERCIASLCRKAARRIVMRKTDILVPSKETLFDFLGKKVHTYEIAKEGELIGVVNGLAWTSVGGDTLAIEVAVSDGNGSLELTGHLGDVMKESAKTAIGHLRSNASVYGLKDIAWDKINLHVHVPEGAVPKDGPSAGITIATALISALSKRGVSRKLAMTGEITLIGHVLPIGGLREKLLAADRSALTQIILPAENKEDLKDIPQDILQNLRIEFAETMSEVYQSVFFGGSRENQ